MPESISNPIESEESKEISQAFDNTMDISTKYYEKNQTFAMLHEKDPVSYELVTRAFKAEIETISA